MAEAAPPAEPTPAEAAAPKPAATTPAKAPAESTPATPVGRRPTQPSPGRTAPVASRAASPCAPSRPLTLRTFDLHRASRDDLVAFARANGLEKLTFSKLWTEGQSLERARIGVFQMLVAKFKATEPVPGETGDARGGPAPRAPATTRGGWCPQSVAARAEEDADTRACVDAGAKLPASVPAVVTSFCGANLAAHAAGYVSAFGVVDYVRERFAWRHDAVFIDAEVFGRYTTRTASTRRGRG